jgi:hypothetical protein
VIPFFRETFTCCQQDLHSTCFLFRIINLNFILLLTTPPISISCVVAEAIVVSLVRGRSNFDEPQE